MCFVSIVPIMLAVFVIVRPRDVRRGAFGGTEDTHRLLGYQESRATCRCMSSLTTNMCTSQPCA